MKHSSNWWSDNPHIMFHVAPVEKRAEIQQHGLTPNKPSTGRWDMDVVNQPEGVYFFHSPDDASYWSYENELGPVDVWEVNTERHKLHPDEMMAYPSSYTTKPVTPDEVYLWGPHPDHPEDDEDDGQLPLFTSSTDFPPEALAEARKHPTIESFQKAWINDLHHGMYWHITSDPNFQINPTQAPIDASTMALGQNDTPGLMVSSHPDLWDEMYNFGHDQDGELTDERINNRPWAAQIDLSGVHPDDMRQVNRGFGNEMFVKTPENAHVMRVLPVEDALAEHDRYYTQLPQTLDDLEQLYAQAHQRTSKESMALDPSALRNAYLFHYTLPERVAGIFEKGLTPWDEIGLQSPKSVGYWQPRPGYVYLAEEGYVDERNDEGFIVLQVNVNQLDPSKFSADEDNFNYPVGEHENQEWLDQDLGRGWDRNFKGKPPTGYWEPGLSSLGDWAEMNADFMDRPDVGRASLDMGTIAYKGVIPPSAISFGSEHDEELYNEWLHDPNHWLNEVREAKTAKEFVPNGGDLPFKPGDRVELGGNVQEYGTVVEVHPANEDYVPEECEMCGAPTEGNLYDDGTCMDCGARPHEHDPTIWVSVKLDSGRIVEVADWMLKFIGGMEPVPSKLPASRETYPGPDTPKAIEDMIRNAGWKTALAKD